jgi:AraC-like DNA-binding protein
MRAAREPGIVIQAAAAMTLEELHVLGFAILTAASLRESLALLPRFHGLLTDGPCWEIREGDEAFSARFVWPGARPLEVRVRIEHALALMLRGLRQTIGCAAVPIEVRLRHAAPRDTSVHRAFFDPAPIRWESDHDELWFPAGILGVAPRAANPAMFAYFMEQLERQVPVPGRLSLADRIREELMRELPSGIPNAPRIARRLGMSERALRRGLAEGCASYRNLLHEVQLARARKLLENPHLSVNDVALAVGFSDPTAFSRAYKRWTGRPPGACRRNRE